MSPQSSKFSRFWQELKRRRVIHVITVYASAAFVIIELVNNLAEPLNLPPNLVTIVIVVLAVGFPLAVILSWIYDLTGEGFARTKPIDELPEQQKIKVPNAWKIATYVSFAVIIGLATMNIVGNTRKLHSGDIQSILILPFKNYTGDEQLDMVISGMHSSLIGNVGRITNLTVISKTTSDRYNNTDMTLPQIASELGVDAVIEPAVTCLGDNICFELKLITPDEKQRWFCEYHEPKSQILNLQNRVTKQIADEVKTELTADEEKLLAESRIIDDDAVDAYLKGRYYLDMINPKSLSLAIEYFQKAAEIETDWAAPYAGIAEVGLYEKQMGFGTEPDIIIMIYENLHKAYKLDSNSVEYHHANAVTAAWTEFDWEKAEKEFLKALELNPSHARSHSFYAHVLSIQRRTDEALYHGRISVELDPENPLTLGLYVEVLRVAGKCEEALHYGKKAYSIDTDNIFSTGRLRDAYICSGDYQSAFETWEKIKYNHWESLGVRELLEKTFHEQGWTAFIKELTRINKEIMELDPQELAYNMAHKYFLLGDYEKSMDNYEILFEINNHFPDLPYISCKPTYDKMKDNPKYLALLKNMNLPLTD